nr:reverse transcriptase domain-containing protein [Tanacetum cinerariifolium]
EVTKRHLEALELKGGDGGACEVLGWLLGCSSGKVVMVMAVNTNNTEGLLFNHNEPRENSTNGIDMVFFIRLGKFKSFNEGERLNGGKIMALLNVEDDVGCERTKDVMDGGKIKYDSFSVSKVKENQEKDKSDQNRTKTGSGFIHDIHVLLSLCFDPGLLQNSPVIKLPIRLHPRILPLKGRIRRSSKQKVENSNFEENPLPHEIPMAENQTMAQLLQAPTDGYEDAIVIPEIAATNFKLKHSLINLVQNKQFFEHEKEDPHAHLRYFNKITSTMRISNVPNSMIKLMLFPFSLEGAAWILLEKEPRRSILTWDDLVSKFINQALLLDKKNQYSAQTPSPTPALIKVVNDGYRKSDVSICYVQGSSKRIVGSIAGGGCYDNLIGMFGTKRVAATGVGLGIEHVFTISEQNQKRKFSK